MAGDTRANFYQELMSVDSVVNKYPSWAEASLYISAVGICVGGLLASIFAYCCGHKVYERHKPMQTFNAFYHTLCGVFLVISTACARSKYED